MREHAADPTNYWGSRGRRFKSCRPDRSEVREARVTAAPGAAPETGAGTQPATDRIVTIPNALSVLRLFGIPLFLWLSLHIPFGLLR